MNSFKPFVSSKIKRSVCLFLVIALIFSSTSFAFAEELDGATSLDKLEISDGRTDLDEGLEDAWSDEEGRPEDKNAIEDQPLQKEAPELIDPEENELAVEDASIESVPSVSYRTHIQNIGWQNYVNDGALSGTTGRSLRLEGINVNVSGIADLGIRYRTHVQNIGWQDWKSDNDLSGTSGRSLRLEAIQIELTGAAKDGYDIYYHVHCQNIGWLDWARNGVTSGSVGYSSRLEAIEIKLVPAGAAAPGSTARPYRDATRGDGTLNYRTHVQNVGWQSFVSDGAVSGTTGRSFRLEGINVNVSGIADLGIRYRTHVQNIGWQDWKSDNDLSGTSGRSLRLEAIQIELTGAAKDSYDVYYRVHCQNFGWLSWAKNGGEAGSSGFSLRLEAIEIQLIPREGAAPEDTAMPMVSVAYDYCAKSDGQSVFGGAQTNGSTAGVTGQSNAIKQIKMQIGDSSVVSGGMKYSTHLSNIGWTTEVSNGVISGDGKNNIEAFKVQLTGKVASYFDVYYRVHVSNIGWMGWAKNGGYAGTTGYGLKVEAYQIKIIAKGSSGPGSTSGAYIKSVTGDYLLDRELSNIAASRGNDLYGCYAYVAGYPYINGSLYPSGNWMPPMAKEMLQNGGGNCYRSAALFCALALQLGYDANVVSGHLPTRSGGRSAHGWTEIHINGQTYICDPNMQRSYPQYGFYMITYANAPISYLL